MTYYEFVKEIKTAQISQLKQPSNLEAEQALIGSILVNNDIIDEISNIINPSTFYDPAHIKIYEVIHIVIGFRSRILPFS